MAPSFDLPCDGDGVCMACKKAPPEVETVTCRTCATPWHVPCLSAPPETLASVADWQCPDCSPPSDLPPPSSDGGGSALPSAASGLIASIRAIEADGWLTEKEKARKRQALISGGLVIAEDEEEEKGKGKKKGKGREREEKDVLDLLDEKFNCAFCMQLPERPVTTPCGHNFCLKCFQKWIGQSKRTCVKCRAPIPSNMASQPRINSSLVFAIRMAKAAKTPSANATSTSVYHFIGNENRPETAFTTERAKKTGKANACSGQIFVTIPPDHFGPILAEHDPKRNKGVLVGELWEDRMECRQWGAHFPHVAGIAGQTGYGAQSVALSGGYEDDEDHGEWFLYTGSGGRDLSGNKRTNKDQSFDQTFVKLNEALRVSCRKGYPVRVVRSHKEKRSSYAPESGVRYDGIYRIEKCWRKVGIQGFKVCRYLFVRCDNEPAPWTSDEQGDRPRPLPAIKELKEATDITVRKGNPAWDYDQEKNGWKWTVPTPKSRKLAASGNTEERKRGHKTRRHGSYTVRERLLKEFSCQICWKVMTLPLTTPCAHNFCKQCLLEAYDDQSYMRDRTHGGRTLRAQKIVKKCPSCPNDISDFLQNPQVNREVMDLIETLKRKSEDENVDEPSEESDVLEKSGEGSDAAEEKKFDDTENDAEDQHNLSENGNDGVEEKKLESVDGDSEVHAVTSESEESVERPDGKASRKRKQTVVRKCAGKRTRKSKEDSSDEVVDQKMTDGGSKVKGVSSGLGVPGGKVAQVQVKAKNPPQPVVENRRITRSYKLQCGS